MNFDLILTLISYLINLNGYRKKFIFLRDYDFGFGMGYADWAWVGVGVGVAKTRQNISSK